MCTANKAENMEVSQLHTGSEIITKLLKCSHIEKKIQL